MKTSNYSLSFFKIIIIFFIFLLSFCSNEPSYHYTKEKFELGPVSAKVDLRNMIRNHIVRRSCELLEAGAEKRISAFNSGNWQVWRDSVRIKVLKEMGGMPFGENGTPLKQALLDACHIRIRPIMMTVLTTALALLPVAIGFSKEAKMQSPMAIVILSGLTVSTCLTLVIIPVLYYYIDKKIFKEK